MSGNIVAHVEEALSDIAERTIYVVRARGNTRPPVRPAISMIRFKHVPPDFKKVPIGIGDEVVCDEHTRCIVHFVLGSGFIVPPSGSARIVSERSAEATGYSLAAHIKRQFINLSSGVLQAAMGYEVGAAIMAGGAAIGTVTAEANAEVTACVVNVVNFAATLTRIGPAMPVSGSRFEITGRAMGIKG